MEPSDFSAYRVLVLGAKTHGILLLRSVLNIMRGRQGCSCRTSPARLELLRIEHFNAVFCDLAVDAPNRPLSCRRGAINPCSIP